MTEHIQNTSKSIASTEWSSPEIFAGGGAVSKKVEDLGGYTHAGDERYDEHPIENLVSRWTVRRSDGKLESGWIESGRGVRGGIEYAKLFKDDLEKDVPIIELQAIKEMVKKPRLELADQALEMASVGQSELTEPFAQQEKPQTLDEMTEYGWVVPRSKLLAELANAEEAQKSPEQTRHERLFAFPKPQGRDKWGNDKDTRLRTTPESERDAALAFRFVGDDTVRKLVKEYARKEGKWRDEEMAEVLRSNDALRIELGEYLLKKIGDMTSLPSRLYTKEKKNPSHTGYEQNMTSSEYAALLAIGMLDGTFNAERAKNDPIEEDKLGEIKAGQHRYAALQSLGLDRSPLAKIKYNH